MVTGLFSFVQSNMRILIWLFFLPTMCQSQQTNILIIMVDDMGIGDIPCYGNKTIPMPNVAALCKNGATLTHHTAPHTICTPSRAAFQTGRYPIRSGMAGWQDNKSPDSPPVIIFTSSKTGLPPNETSIGTVAKMAGYSTGLVGKWHLGLNDKWYNDMKRGPLGHGYDYFFGLPYTLVDAFQSKDTFFTMKNSDYAEIIWVMLLMIPTRLFLNNRTFWLVLVLQGCLTWFMLEHFRLHQYKMSWWGRSPFMYKFLNSYLMENHKVVEKPISLEPLALRLAKKSIDFMERAATLEKPFLLIHAFGHVHTPLYTSPQFKNLSPGHGAYGDALIETDYVVGLLMQKLRELNLENNTFVYFTSDHGGDIQVGKRGGFNGPFRGGKGNGALEGGMRIPGVIQWPGVVKPGSEIADISSNMDILPTVIEITGADTKSKKLELDGESLVPLLKDPGHKPHLSKRVLYHMCFSEVFAARLNYKEKVYKAIFKEPYISKKGTCSSRFCKCYGYFNVQNYGREPLLFDINEDEGENNPISTTNETYSEVMQLMLKEHAKFTEQVERTKMASQYAQKHLVMPLPWLQPAWFDVEYNDK